MKGRKQQVPDLPEEVAARILQNVFEACGVSPNETPFYELAEKYRDSQGCMTQSGDIIYARVKGRSDV